MSVHYDDDERALLRAARAEKPQTDLRTKALAAAALASATAVVASSVGGKAAVGASKAGLAGVLSWASLGARVMPLKGLLVAATAVVVFGVAIRERVRTDASPPVAQTAAHLVTLPVAPSGASQEAHNAPAPWTTEPMTNPQAPDQAPQPQKLTVVSERKSLATAKPSATPEAPAYAKATATEPPLAATTVAPPAPNPEPSVRSSQTLGDELRLVDSARASLVEGNASAALSSLDRHAARFPSGTFAMERETLRVSALLALGRKDEAKQIAKAFVVRYPSSAGASNMRLLLKE
jgi:TolA-binding protein